MPVLLEPCEDLIALRDHVDFVTADILPEDLSDYWEIVEGREYGNAIRHKPDQNATIPVLFQASQIVSGLSSEYWAAQIGFRWEQSDPAPLTGDLQIDILTFEKFGVRIAPTPDEKSQKFRTFKVIPIQLASLAPLQYNGILVNPNAMLQGPSWYTLKMAVRIHPTLGSYQIDVIRRSDGSTVLSIGATNTNTTGFTGTSGAFGCQIRTRPGLTIDDIKIAHGVTDAVIEATETVLLDVPTGDGDSSEWSKSDDGIDNYEHVDEIDTTGVDVDDKRLTASVASTQDLYTFPALPAEVPSGATIPRVNISLYGAGDPTQDVRPLHRSGGAVESLMGAVEVPFDSASSVGRKTWDQKTNPDGGGAWSKANIDASEFGVRLIG